MLYIYVDQISDRCIYTFDFVFKENNIPYRITNDVKYFNEYQGNKFNYSERQFENVVTLKCATMLFEEHVSVPLVLLEQFENEPCFSLDGIVDPFAAVFYILSRMEEYSDNSIRDEHNRYHPRKSVLFQNDLLDKLVCDRWSKAIINFLYQHKVVENPFVAKPVTLHPSFDIDHTYAYLYKPLWRSALISIRDLIQNNGARKIERKKVVSGEIKDPYDTFETILEIGKIHPTHVFWLLGNYTQYDRNCSHAHPKHQRLIRTVSTTCTVGIHPSYQSNSVGGQVKEEIGRLSSILGHSVKHSRQHFLKLDFPKTYHELLAEGIEHDFTMGFASEIGFRAGTLRPFKWFDLSKNQITDLTIHPFAYMDGTIHEYKKWSVDQAQDAIQKLFNEAKAFGGDFYFLWHNETIGDYGKWRGWKSVLDFTLNLK